MYHCVPCGHFSHVISISFGAKDLFALGTFNIGMYLCVLFHLLETACCQKQKVNRKGSTNPLMDGFGDWFIFSLVLEQCGLNILSCIKEGCNTTILQIYIKFQDNLTKRTGVKWTPFSAAIQILTHCLPCSFNSCTLINFVA